MNFICNFGYLLFRRKSGLFLLYLFYILLELHIVEWHRQWKSSLCEESFMALSVVWLEFISWSSVIGLNTNTDSWGLIYF